MIRKVIIIIIIRGECQSIPQMIGSNGIVRNSARNILEIAYKIPPTRFGEIGKDFSRINFGSVQGLATGTS